MRKITSIQGLRFFLFLAVFLYHCGSHLFAIGWAGVQCFLVLSAYFLTKSLTGKERLEINVWEQMKKRIKRIYPAYLLLIFASSILFIAYQHRFPNDFAYYIFSLQNFYWCHSGHISDLRFLAGHTWYVPVDLFLFLIWTTLIRFSKKERLNLIFYICIIAALAWRTWCTLISDNGFLAFGMPFGELDSFAFGGLLATGAINKKQFHGKMPMFMTIAGIIGLTICLLSSAQVIARNCYLFIAMFGTGLIFYCLSEKRKHPVLSNAKIVTLGEWSYVLYIVHYPIIWATQWFTENIYLIIVFALSMSIGVTFLHQKYINPFISRILR